MPRFIGRFLAIVLVAARRLWSNRWLSLAAASGFAVVVMFALCVPLYADAVYHRVLSKELGVVRDDGPRLPPFAFVFRNGAYWLQTDPWADIQRADDFIDRQLPFFLDLPRRTLVRYLQTTRFEIYPAAGLGYGQPGQRLLKAPLTAVSDFGQHIRLTEGELPPAFDEPGFALDRAPSLPADGGPLPVLVSQLLADELGIQIGDRYDATTEAGVSPPMTVPMQVAGVWLPRDPQEPYWFNKPYQMGHMFIVSQRDFADRLAPGLGKQFADAQWYADFDGDGVRVWDVPALVARIDDLIRRGKTPGLNLSVAVSPLQALTRYQQDAQALQSQLYAFSVPVFVLALAFVLLVAGLTANDQRNEVAVLRSRGASMGQTVGIALLQATLAGAAGALAAVPLSLLVVSWLGQIRSFLNFSGAEPLQVTVTAAGLPLGAAAAAVTILLMTVPALESARHTIVTYKAERARALKPPGWQRIGLDILLLIPAAY
jgi:putative ABC transport system permease protein